MNLEGFVWVNIEENKYLGVKFADSINEYVYRFKTRDLKPTDILSKNKPNKLTEKDMPYIHLKTDLSVWEISKTLTDILNELQIVLDNPELSINPYDDEKDDEDENKPTETVSTDDDAETDDNINLDFIPSQLEKYDNDILKMLDENVTEYVGDKSNLLMLILSVVAVKCGLRSFIININGDSLSGKTTLIKTLFNLIPDYMIENHNNSTISGIIRNITPIGEAVYRLKTNYDRTLIYLGNATYERKKQLTRIEELTLTLYKENEYISTMGSKTATEKTQTVDLKSDTFLALTKSVKPYKSSNTEINDITTYLTVTPVSKHDLIQQLQLNHKDNNPEFMEQHQQYIENLNPMDIEQDFFNNPELLEHIIEATNDLNYVEFVNYKILYISYCIYLNISPSISSFDTFQSLIPDSTTLTDKEQDLMDYLKKHHTNKETILESKTRKGDFKYFSVDNFRSYRPNEYNKHDNFNKTVDSMVRKGVLNKTADGLYYLD